MASTVNANSVTAWWAGLDRMMEKISNDPMSSAQTLRCCYPDCGVRLDSVGWICVCRHAYCETHAPVLVRGTSSAPNTNSSMRRCHLCKTDLPSSEVQRFSVEANRSAGKFSQVGRSLNETFDMLACTLDWSVKEDQRRDALLAKLREMAESDDRELAEAEAAKEAARIELTGLQVECGKLRHSCKQFANSLSTAQKHLNDMTGKMRQYFDACKAVERSVADTRNQGDGLKRQLADRERENKRISNQVTAAGERLQQFRQLGLGDSAAASSHSRHSNQAPSDVTSNIGPSASAVGGPASESDYE